jgi:hypothetical protein
VRCSTEEGVADVKLFEVSLLVLLGCALGVEVAQDAGVLEVLLGIILGIET